MVVKILKEVKEGVKEIVELMKKGKEIKITIIIGVSENEKEKLKTLNAPIEELDLSVRAEKVLKENGIYFVKDLIQKDPEELLKMKHMGRKSVKEIQKALEKKGLVLTPPSERKEVRQNVDRKMDAKTGCSLR